MSGKEGGEGMFPLVERQTPLLDRVRERNGSSDKDSPQIMARVMAETVQADDAVRRQTGAEFAEEFESALSDELGVDQSDINPEIADMFEQMLVGINVDELFTEEAAREQGLLDEPEEEEVSDEEEDDQESGDDAMFGGSSDEEGEEGDEQADMV